MSSLGNRIQKSILSPIGNVGSGIMLKVFKPFRKGDFIEIDGQLGSVEKCGFRKTIVKKMDGGELKLENSTFYTKNLHNLSSKNIIRLDLTLGISYQSNMSKVKDEIIQYLSQNKRLLNSPIPKIQVRKIKNDFVEIIVRPWCLLDDYLELDATLESLLKQYLASRNVGIEYDNTHLSGAKMLA